MDFNINGSLCFEELVLMMRSCVSGLLKFMGHAECPPDEEFELLASDALQESAKSSRTSGGNVVGNDLLNAQSGAINFREFMSATIVRQRSTPVQA